MKRLIRPSLTLRGVTPTLVAYKYWHTNYKGVCVCVCVCACVRGSPSSKVTKCCTKERFICWQI